MFPSFQYSGIFVESTSASSSPPHAQGSGTSQTTPGRQLRHLLQQRNTARIVLDQIVVRGKNAGDGALDWEWRKP